jgi:WD40 repeat protein
MADGDEVEQLRAGIRAWLLHAARSGGHELRGISAPAMLSLLCAAAFGPVLSAAAGLTSATAIAGIGVLSSVGGGVLGDVLGSALERARSSATGEEPSQADLEREVARSIQEILAAQDVHAEEVRSGIATVLREIDAGGTVLRAAIEAGNEELQREVLAAVDALSADFGDMGFMLVGLGRAAAEIQESLGGQGTQLRALIDQIGRQSADVRMVREELAVLTQRTPRWMPGHPASEGIGLRWVGECPYRGLLPYDQSHEAVFYGRERLTAELASMLAGSGIVIVTGASGAGKSSLLHAGLVPALGRGVQVSGSSSWPRISMTPTAHPLAELAAHLAAVGGGDPAAIRQRIADTPGEGELVAREILLAVASRGQEPGESGDAARLVLIIDQFEQVFDLLGENGERERSAFIEVLCTAATRPAGPRDVPPALVVIAVRGDYWDRCAAYSGLVRAMRQGQFVVGPMTEADLRRVITGPAQASGLRIETGLADSILADLRGAGSEQAAGVLPLLSQAMMLTWGNREDNWLTSRGYGSTGGVARAVEVGADGIYDALTENQKIIARDVLRRMTALGIDRRLARRPVSRADLRMAHPESERAQVDAVLEAFAGGRLVVLNADRAEISHDALLQAWPRLRGWLEEDQASVILHGQLTEDAAAWRMNGNDSSFLYRGAQLAAVKQAVSVWEADQGRFAALTPDEAAFLRISRRAATRAGRQRQALAATLVVLLVAAVAGAAIALVAARNANSAARIADQQRNTAISERLATQSAALDAVDPVTASLLAAAAWRVAPTAQARYSLLESLAQPVRGVLLPGDGVVTALAYSPDGKILAAGYQGGAIDLWDLVSHHLVRSTSWNPAVQGNSVIALTFTDGGKVLEAAYPGAVGVWDIGRQAKITPQPLSGLVAVFGEAFSPDGTMLATATGNGIIQLWSVATRHQIGDPMSADTQPVNAVVFSPDGKILATGASDGTARLWSVATQHQIGDPMSADTQSVNAVAFSPDGKILATGASDGTSRLWNAATRTEIGSPMHAAQSVAAVTFDFTGRTMAAAGSDGSAQLWDVASHDRTGAPLTAPGSGGVSSLAFSPATGILATGNQNGAIQLWNPAVFQQTSSPLSISGLRMESKFIDSTVAVFSANHKFMASESQYGIRLWNVVTGQPIGPWIASPGNETGFAVSPDGMILAIAAGDVQLWNAATGRRLGKPMGGSNAFEVAFAANGKLLYISDQNGKSRIWDIATQLPIRNAVAGGFPDAFSPDGKVIAIPGGTLREGKVQLWDSAAGQRIGAAMTVGTQPEAAAAFSPDSKILATADDDGTIRLWDVATQQEIGTPMTAGAAPVYSAAFSPDGTMLATADGDGTTRLWDVATQQEIGAPMTADTRPVMAVTFSTDGTVLETASADGTVRLWNVAFPREMLSAACATASQSLTRQQWADYVGTQSFQQACP